MIARRYARRAEAVLADHFPVDLAEAAKARERLAFEELLLLQLAVLRQRRQLALVRATAVKGPGIIPVVDASGPSKVTVGGDATFDVLVSFNDAPYAADDLEGILFLLYNSEGSMIGKGQAEYVAEGQYVINLTPELTAQLKEGASQMEIIATSKLVAIPVFATVNFIAAP